MSRLRSIPPDSLEMLLDTMCNAFGGIILIALLVTVLARDAKISTPTTPTQPETSGMLQRQVDQASRDLARARDLQAELRQRTADPAHRTLLLQISERDQARRLAEQLLSELRAATAASRTNPAASLDEAIDRIRTLAAANHRTERRLAEERNLRASLATRVEELRRSLQAQSNRLAQANSRLTQRLRLPREHPTTKDHLYLILRHGRVYPVYFVRGGVPEQNTTSLVWTAEPSGSRRIDPIPGAGILPDPTAPALGSFLREIPHDRFYLLFQVYPDSFEAFTQVRIAAVARGFDCGLEFRLETTPLRLGTGAPRPAGVQ